MRRVLTAALAVTLLLSPLLLVLLLRVRDRLRPTPRESDAELAREAGQLRAEVDARELARTFVAHQWGVILVWSKGLLSLEDFLRQSLQSRLLTLAPACEPALERRLRDNLERALAS